MPTTARYLSVVDLKEHRYSDFAPHIGWSTKTPLRKISTAQDFIGVFDLWGGHGDQTAEDSIPWEGQALNQILSVGKRDEIKAYT